VAEQLLQSGGPLSTRAEKRSELAKTNANKVEQVSRLLAVGTAVGMRVTHTRDNGRECYGSYFSTVSNSDYLNLNSLRHSFEIVGADRRHEQRDRQHDKECQAAAFAPRHSLLITSAPSQSQLRMSGKSCCKKLSCVVYPAELYKLSTTTLHSETMAIHASIRTVLEGRTELPRIWWCFRNGEGPDHPC
jgi:hypothetical protein